MNVFALWARCDLAEPLGSASSWKCVSASVFGNFALEQSHLVEGNLHFLHVSAPEEMWLEAISSNKSFGVFSLDYL